MKIKARIRAYRSEVEAAFNLSHSNPCFEGSLAELQNYINTTFEEFPEAEIVKITLPWMSEEHRQIRNKQILAPWEFGEIEERTVECKQ